MLFEINLNLIAVCTSNGFGRERGGWEGASVIIEITKKATLKRLISSFDSTATPEPLQTVFAWVRMSYEVK